MKTRTLFFLSIAIATLCSYNLSEGAPNEIDPSTAKKKTWTKSVWSIIDSSSVENKPLFFPLNDYFIGMDNDAQEFDFALMEAQKSALKENLWNILIYHFHKGNLDLYLPYDPDWLSTRDEGFLFFPLTVDKFNITATGTYNENEEFKSLINSFEVIGYEEVDPNPMAMTDIEGYDSLDANRNVVYYPNNFIWYEDNYINSYKIKETWTLNEAGEIIGKKIDAIAPRIKKFDAYSGVEMGIEELFWIDYAILEPLLTQYYLLDYKETKNKIYSLEDYFKERKFSSSVVKEDSVHVR